MRGEGGVYDTRSARASWRTDPEFFAGVDRRFRFGLDAAANASNALTVKYLSDSLHADWCAESAGRPVWSNPPFNLLGGVRGFVAKASLEGRHVTVAMLIPASRDCAWYADYVHTTAAEVWDIEGRLHYCDENGVRQRNVMFASMLVVWIPGMRGEAPIYAGMLDRRGRPAPRDRARWSLPPS